MPQFSNISWKFLGFLVVFILFVGLVVSYWVGVFSKVSFKVFFGMVVRVFKFSGSFDGVYIGSGKGVSLLGSKLSSKDRSVEKISTKSVGSAFGKKGVVL